jgi:two-component system, response regulator PdtaR
MTTMTPSLPSLRIVVVEDDATVRQFLRDALEKDLGHQVIGEASNGKEMVETVLQLQPDVVVFDIHLPIQDGFEGLKQIYQEQIVAAVAITADRDQDLVRRALEEHVLAYLVKPVDAQQLGPALQVAWARFQELHNLTSENASLRQNLHNRKIIERAKGVMMKRHRWSEAEAFRRIQRAAMNRRMAMIDLAQAILDGQNIEL